MRQQGLLGLCLKGLILASSTILILLPWAIYVHDIQNHLEPRLSLLNRINIKDYPFVLMGDSSFNSGYVDDDTDSIWEKFKTFTGKKCYPGTLGGAGKIDFINFARYLSDQMQPGSTVFIDLLKPNLNDRFNKGQYDYALAHLLKKETFIGYKFFNYLNLEYAKYIFKPFSGYKKYDRDEHFSYNRVWNIDGSFAKDFLKIYVKDFPDIEGVDSRDWLKEIEEIFHGKRIKAVFVLMPFNEKMFYTCLEKEKADAIYKKIEYIHEQNKEYLKVMNFPFIDLFNKIPDHCFADFMHTNACGDEIIAKALAEYALKR